MEQTETQLEQALDQIKILERVLQSNKCYQSSLENVSGSGGVSGGVSESEESVQDSRQDLVKWVYLQSIIILWLSFMWNKISISLKDNIFPLILTLPHLLFHSK